MSIAMNLRSQNLERLIHATYYAPRGRQRLYTLGAALGQRYLSPDDHLVGIIGAEGSGKSTLIRGLFPGVELTNDDEGVNIRPTPIYDFDPGNFFAPHTFHVDIRYELAFHQKYEIVEAIRAAIDHGRRVVVEHFDLIFEALGMNAHILFGIGEEVVVARPSVFGPFPGAIKRVVDRTIRFRLMAHSAQDITTSILTTVYGHRETMFHSDVKHGFVVGFADPPAIDIAQLEKKVLEVIARDEPISAVDENHIRVGSIELVCTGTRTHVASTGQIENFRLVHQFKYDPLTRDHLLVGMVGRREIAGLEDLSYFTESAEGAAPPGPPVTEGETR